MQESSWEDGRVVLSARGSGSGGHSVTPGGGQGGSATAAAASRTQDDARVGYFFQRPQAGGAHQPYDPALLKAWAATDGEASSFHGQVGNCLNLCSLYILQLNITIAICSPNEPAALEYRIGDE